LKVQKLSGNFGLISRRRIKLSGKCERGERPDDVIRHAVGMAQKIRRPFGEYPRGRRQESMFVCVVGSLARAQDRGADTLRKPAAAAGRHSIRRDAKTAFAEGLLRMLNEGRVRELVGRIDQVTSAVRSPRNASVGDAHDRALFMIIDRRIQSDLRG
jgi:hypothetical protein